MQRFGLVIPTLNAGPFLDRLIPAIAEQTAKPDRYIVIDSASDDDTVARFRAAGAEVTSIQRSEFNHGGTRNRGLELLGDVPVALFLTQDARPTSPETFARLISHFDRPEVTGAYGRQLPREEANAIERFARMHNYPPETVQRGKRDIPKYGFKTSFTSNSYCAYRVEALRAVGGFPERTIVGEDTLAFSKMILNGGDVVYDGESAVVHSHGYTIAEEFRRYFDTGVMHAQNQDLMDRFGTIQSAGMAFVKDELKFLGKSEPWRIPEALVRTGSKYLAYRLGRLEQHIPVDVKRRLSMHHRYWNEASA